MKSIVLLVLFLLLCAFTSYLPSATAGLVYDTDGDLLRNGGRYYILAVRRGMGGGIEVAATGKETCPLTVVQSRNELSKGLPLIISSPLRIFNIVEGLILNIEFSIVPRIATTRSEWTIVKGLPEGLAVKLAGYPNTVRGWFKIQKTSHDDKIYKLVFCAESADTCGDIGIDIDSDGIRRLVVTETDPLLVIQFQKVGSTNNCMKRH